MTWRCADSRRCSLSSHPHSFARSYLVRVQQTISECAQTVCSESYWRRGRDSVPLSVLITRNLFISLCHGYRAYHASPI
jgi:hypothetical protein